MNLNDDYLWDKTGEADAEIEQLEELLGRFRHQGKAPELPLQTRRFFWPRLAVAATLVLMLLAGLWIIINRQSSVKPNVEQMATGAGKEVKEKKDEQATDNPNKRDAGPEEDKPNQKQQTSATPKLKQVIASGENRRRGLNANRRDNLAQDSASTVAVVDFETADYLESAQVLLRSFRNIGSEGGGSSDVSYEKERSRDLLYRNIVLRRDAEARGNLPMSNVLGALEPILLDIANLPATSSQADVRQIQERIQKKEIVATLQIYSAPVMAVKQR